MRKRIPFLILFVVCASFLAIAISAYYAFIIKPRRELDRFLTNINTVEIGKTGLENWRQQLQRSKISNFQVICREGSCGIGSRLENSFLTRLKLAPKTVVSAGVDFRNGVASEIYILMVVMRRNDEGQMYEDKGVVVRQSTDRPTSCHQHYDVLVHQRYGIGDRYWATVAMDRCVGSEDRAKAIDINTHCLTRLGGCNTVETMLPKILGDHSN
jgi:hypothetical protein